MGYRFFLSNGTYTSQVKAGNTFNININLMNEGYAAPFNPRWVEIILKNQVDGTECRTKLNIDPKKWLPGSVNVNQDIGIPLTYPPGTYRVYLNLPDPATALYGNPSYSIRLANAGVWDAITGYNDLGMNLVVSNSATGTAYTGSQWFDACYGSDIPPVVTITSPLDHQAFTTGSDITINVSANDPDGTITKVEFYADTTKIGESSVSPYSYTWLGVADSVYTLKAKAIDNLGKIGNSDPIRIAVNATADIPPGIDLTVPLNGQFFSTGSDVTITATADDADGSVSKVEFYADSIKIGESFTSPYSITWSSVPHGSYHITALATDNNSESTVSTVINIVVNNAPAVTLTGPINTVYQVPGTINISANASDSDGNISKVDFYSVSLLSGSVDSVLIGTDSSAPFSFLWTNVPKGIYTITARTTDDYHATTVTNSPIIITVGYPSQTPYGGGGAWPIPGKIEAENYDQGGENIAYLDFTPGNYFQTYRSDDVDIEDCMDIGGGYDISAVLAGEWMEYTVNVTASGNYAIQLRVAATSAGRSFHIEMDDVNITGNIIVPNTGGWQTWTTVTVQNIHLIAGQKIMRVVMDTDLLNLNYVSFQSIATGILKNNTDTKDNIKVFPNPHEGAFQS
jgi:hypothetical protein